MNFSAIQIFAYLSGSWVDISTDVNMTSGLRANWGITGNSATDLLADVGTLTFKLRNSTGKYYPNNASPLTGWGYNTKIKVVFSYNGSSYIRFSGRVSTMNFDVGIVPNTDTVSITVSDWMNEAQKYPLSAPSIEVDKRANDGITTLLSTMPILPDSTSLDTGDNVFPSIFDAANLRTTAYAEIAKLINSEWSHCYMVHNNSGGVLVFEKASHRDASHPVKEIPTTAINYLLLESGGKLLLEDGSGILLDGLSPITITNGWSGLNPTFGNTIVNRMTVLAYPRRIDTDITVLYNLDTPVALAAGQTVTIRAGYKDQTGGGRQVNAITSSMLTPEVPGVTDPYLKTLLHFEGNFTDATGRHTWNQHDVTIQTDVYKDGFGTQFITESVMGSYAIFGGYASYYLSAPTSADFNFGSGEFTIGWYETRINISAGDTAVARNSTSAYPPFKLACSDGSHLRAYFSSNGTSWDIANGQDMGLTNRGKWVYREVSRDADGWFYTFADGKLISKWYSSLSIQASTADLCIGKVFNNNYCYMGLDEFFISHKCLHNKDYIPPTTPRMTTLPGDYLMNTLENGAGTDISANLVITAAYDSAGVDYSLTNNGATAGYVYYLTARGLGVYAYNPVEQSIDDTASQTNNGFSQIILTQRYQQTIEAGALQAATIITNEASPRTDLNSITFLANRDDMSMNIFLLCDVGDLIQVTHTASGIAGRYYYIQSVEIETIENAVRVTYGLRQDYLH